MAKACQLAREAKRLKLIKKNWSKRLELKKIQKDPTKSYLEKFQARLELNQLPRNSSSVRKTTRCQLTGSARSVYRKFKLNRVAFREMALKGYLPGVIKASW